MTECTIRMFEPQDRDWAVAAQADLYQSEYGFDETFGPLCARIVDDFLAGYDSTSECGWVAELDGQPVGTIFCVRLNETTAQLRLFFLVKHARGQGLGPALLKTCMGFARASGYSRMQLWTHRSHVAATRLYRSFGWQCIEAEPKVSFGKQEVVETYCHEF